MITVKLCHNVQLVLDQEQKQIFSSKTGRLNVCTRPVWWVKTLSLSKWESRYLATPHINWTFMGRRSEKSVRKLITLFVAPLAPFPRAMCINRQLLILWLNCDFWGYFPSRNCCCCYIRNGFEPIASLCFSRDCVSNGSNPDS